MLTFLLIGLLIASILMFFSSGQFLIVDQSPVKSDAIILLTGGGVERFEKAAELYHAGYAPLMIISNGLEDGYYNAVMTLGVPQESIISETKAVSTSTNAEYSAEIMKQYNLKSAIVVSSDYHMRRVKINFTRAFLGTGIRLLYSAAPTSYNSIDWYRNQTDIMTTFNEYSKILGNGLGLDGVRSQLICLYTHILRPTILSVQQESKSRQGI